MRRGAWQKARDAISAVLSEGPDQRKRRIVGVKIAGIGRSHKGSFPVLVIIPCRSCCQVMTNIDAQIGQRLEVVVFE